MYYMDSQLDGMGPKEISFSCTKDGCISSETDENGEAIKLDMDGNAGIGTVNIDIEGNVSFKLEKNGYCSYKYAINNDINIIKGKCDNIGVVDMTITKAEKIASHIVEVAQNYVTSFMTENSGVFPDEALTFECTIDGCILETSLDNSYQTENFQKLNLEETNLVSGAVIISNGGKNIQATNLNINNFTCNHLNDETYCGIREYNSGDAYQFGGYNWHVISDDGKYLTLLMDFNQLDSEHQMMQHCTDNDDETNNCGLVDVNGTKYYQYSWDKSQIREYLNGEFLRDLENKIGTNKLETIDICISPSMGSTNEFFYGGYLKSEIENLGVTCNSNYVSDKVRLITVSELYNISPYYENVSLPYAGHLLSDEYDNMGRIPRLNLITRTTTTDWLYSYFWWTMTAFSGRFGSDYKRAYRIHATGLGSAYGHEGDAVQIRPVITIIK